MYKAMWRRKEIFERSGVGVVSSLQHRYMFVFTLSWYLTVKFLIKYSSG